LRRFHVNPSKSSPARQNMVEAVLFGLLSSVLKC
jgi:hypothetical protein